jgi:FHA domain-containing protein
MGDPFADLLPPTAAPKAAAPQPAPARASDPFADPFADPFGAPPSAPPAGGGGGVIPHDYDPFADLLPHANTPASPPAAAPPLSSPHSSPHSSPLGLPAASGGSVDDLFGLGAANTWDPLSPTGALGGASILRAPDSGIDPFADLMPEPAKPKAVPQRDDAPMLSSALPRPSPALHPPPVREMPPAAAPQPPQQPPLQPAPRAAAQGADMVVSWNSEQSDEAPEEIKTVILPSPKRAAAAASRPPVQERIGPLETAPPPLAPPAAIPPAAPRAPQAAPVAAPVAAAAQQPPNELLRAFLEGAGAPELKIPGGLTPELMTLIGRLMHESVRGTLDLLLARALTKREVRAQATVIVARENNPLKFSPSVDAAFKNLLAPQGQGFMAPADAMRDAYNDLRSHQFGFMAGMRAALEGVLARFDPAHLEGRLTRKSMLASLVPSSRRAQLWELYEQLYRDISKEAQDDFQTLFGKEFLRAYEAQIDKLEQEDAANKR